MPVIRGSRRTLGSAFEEATGALSLQGGTFSATGPVHLGVLVAIVFLTSLNGLFCALNAEYGGSHPTFLGDPGDRHADLIKPALAMPPFVQNLAATRERRFALIGANNPYPGLEEAKRGELSSLHVMPFFLLSLLGIKRAILWLGPDLVIGWFYAIALTVLALLCLRVTLSRKQALLAFVAMGVSYPFLMILSCGNYGGLITTLCLIGFIHQALVGKRAVLAAVFLAVAFNCRPNVLLLAPLFLSFGGRGCLRGIIIFLGAAAVLLVGSYVADVILYPGYNFAIFQKAIGTYYQLYVIEQRGARFNNSAYGAIWFALHNVQVSGLSLPGALKIVQVALTAATGVLIGLFTWAYLRRQLDTYEYAFSLSILYIFGSTIFATYHLFFLFVFVLIGIDPSRKNTRLFILAATVFLLVPKNYFYLDDISLEVLLNPMAIAIALALIYANRAAALEKPPVGWSLPKAWV